ncbi:MAG: DUF3372 domain-containing protein, partial [Chloroflexi bacterium]|nr:DUF3372 domain-containing protein [Chloroflexota bacterium]
MRRLMIDSVVTWVRDYQVDGFRFDLMGHHMVEDMRAVREALDSLTLEEDGVDGASIYVYGEGWDFGEVANNTRGVNATQLNLPGTGIGTFNDRLRDAVRGGNPFGGLQEQGFSNGLFTDPSSFDQGTPEEQQARLLLFADQIRAGLAGNLRDYSFEGASGDMITGADLDYNGFPVAYTLDPQEHIVYVSAHDNETIFDVIQAKAPETATVADRVRMHNMALSIVALSQGVPFFHAGDDMLRSKSLDGNSYDSGDWFNRLDFTYQTNNWAVGLPPAWDNEGKWDVTAPLLETAALVPAPDDIMNGVMHLREMLAIRSSSPLFRLQTADAVFERVAFHNTGPEQVPGVIIMSIADLEGEDLDPDHELIVVVFNATPEAQMLSVTDLEGVSLSLHPLQAESHDPVVQTASFAADSGTLTVPARTTAVFVLGE